MTVYLLYVAVITGNITHLDVEVFTDQQRCLKVGTAAKEELSKKYVNVIMECKERKVIEGN